MRLIGTVVVACLTLGAARVGAQDDPWWGRDKALHLAAGSALAAGGYAAGALVFEDRDKRIAAGLAASIGASAVKEWRDRSSVDGTPSWRDFTWGAAGAAAGVTVAWLIDRARSRPPAPRPSPVLVPYVRR